MSTSIGKEFISMAKKVSLVKLNLLSVISFVTLLIILASVFVLSGSFSDLVTTITKSKASMANPKLTEGYSDAFKDGVVNTEKLAALISGDATITETAADNLKITIPAGKQNNKTKGGKLEFKQTFNDTGDFRVVAVVYRPVITGEGTGITGVRFASTGTDDDEGAAIGWRVSGTNSKIWFVVRGPDGTKLESQQDTLDSNIAVLRLERVNKKYRAFYKPGRDLTGDVGWKPLGSEWNAALGNEGRVYLYANNQGAAGKYPKVIGRIDQVSIHWEGAPSQKTSFTDAFANDVVGKNWKTAKNTGGQVYENTKDKLIMSLPNGAVQNKPRYTYINRKEPAIPEGKEFAIQAQLFKPTVVGEGGGYAGIRFASAGNVDDEAAMVRWVVGTNANRLVFLVRAPDGTLSERAVVNLTGTEKKLTLRLTRVGDKYKGWYRTGDSDTDWVLIGKEESANFGANGQMGLVVGNGLVAGKFPRVIGRFDFASGSVAK